MKSNLLLIASACMLSLIACTKDQDNSTNISDVSLSAMTSSDDLITMRTTGSETKEQWVIKMNEAASRIHSHDLNQYPANSMIVKEKHGTDGKISGYDVMYRSPGDANSVDGWLMCELDGNKNIIYSAAQKGVTCNSCHSIERRDQH